MPHVAMSFKSRNGRRSEIAQRAHFESGSPGASQTAPPTLSRSLTSTVRTTYSPERSNRARRLACGNFAGDVFQRFVGLFFFGQLLHDHAAGSALSSRSGPARLPDRSCHLADRQTDPETSPVGSRDESVPLPRSSSALPSAADPMHFPRRWPSQATPQSVRAMRRCFAYSQRRIFAWRSNEGTFSAPSSPSFALTTQKLFLWDEAFNCFAPQTVELLLSTDHDDLFEVLRQRI